jgi:hypothetical protein
MQYRTVWHEAFDKLRLSGRRCLGQTSKDSSVNNRAIDASKHGDHSDPMIRKTKRLFVRLSRQQKSGLVQSYSRRTFGERWHGYKKSERADAKLLLIAMAPGFVVTGLLELGILNSETWPAAFLIALGWLVIIGAFTMKNYVQSAWHHIRNRQ